MGGLFLARHDEAAKEWGALGSRALVPGAITCKPKINSTIVQGGRTGAGVRQDGGTAKGGVYTIGESQGGSGPTVNGAAVFARRPGQVQVPAD